jgi:ABC-type oligopeptide transport system substrate-binding subunit
LRGNSLDDHSLDELYQAERSLLDGHTVIPLFQLPVASAAGARVRGWAPDRLGAWSAVPDLWLASGPAEQRPASAQTYGPQLEAGSQ